MRTDAGPWSPYAPSVEDPWNLRKVGHLHRRAGFGATWAELKRDLAAGPAQSVARLLDPPAPKTEEAQTFDLLCGAAIAADDLDRLKAAWLYRIVYGADPLREKLTLFWHGYFATSVVKVRSLSPMYRQHAALRQHALDGFATLLSAMVVDPAMLVWLDGSGNRKEKPNENFAREFLELFAVGAGHFTEADVREAARAFTGWIAVGADPRAATEAARFDRDLFDDGPKTMLGRTGRWGHADVVRIALELPAAAEHLASRLYRFFISEAAEPAPELIGSLAKELREHDYSIRHVIGVILRSRHFFAQAVARQRIKGPVEFAAGLARVLEVPPASLNLLALAAACDRQGQELFAPPNVKGWDGGTTWLNSATLLERAAWSNDIVWGNPAFGLAQFDPLAWAIGHGIVAGRLADSLADLLVQGDLGADALALIRTAGRSGRPDGLRQGLQRLLNCPEFQLA